MSSMFETEVYQRERATPFTRISLTELMKTLAAEIPEGGDPEVTLTVRSRHSVSTGFWWALSWVDRNGDVRTMDAQTLEKCLWRVATLYARDRD